MASVSLDTMLTNLSETFPSLIRLVTATSYVIGIGLAWNAIYKLKQYGEMRTMMSANTDLRGPIVLIIVAVALLYLPSTLITMRTTAFGTENPLAYNFETGSPWDDFVAVIILFVQLVGLVAFIRGWLLLVRVGTQGAQPGTTTKAIVHIIGGIFAINVDATAKLVAETLGIDLGFAFGS